MTPIFGVVGWKNSGKTTLTAKLIANFAARGLEVAAIKHAHHGFDIDQKGRDSYRFREAGARTVALSSSRRVAIMTELRGKQEPTLEELAARVRPADLILVEGFKRENHPKLEVRRKESPNQSPLAPDDPSILAIAANFPIDKGDLPVFDLNSVDEIAGFILDRIGLMNMELSRDRS